MAERLEDALSISEQDAKNVSQAARRLESEARRMEKAAANGELNQLREARARLLETAKSALKIAEEASVRWPWSVPEEEEFLASEYITEIQTAAAGMEIPFHRYSESLGSSYPVLVRVEPKTKSVRLDRRRVRDLRPSVLLQRILKIRQEKPRQKPEQFLEILYAGYLSALGRKALETDAVRPGSSVQVTDVHQALTLLPDARKDYPLDEFARDLHRLNKSGLRKTRSGYTLYLASSAAIRSGAGVLTIFDDDARKSDYFSLSFQNGEPT